MVDWCIHKEWDSKLGIPPNVSDYIVHAIDSKSLSDKKIPMSEDFKKHTEERKIPRAGGNNFSIADLRANLHDRYRNKLIQEEDLKFLLIKGGEYIRAYYLHIFLDYLNGKPMRGWMHDTGDTVETCLDKCQKNKSVSLSETQATLAQVVDFLKKHSEEIKHDLNL